MAEEPALPATGGARMRGASKEEPALPATGGARMRGASNGSGYVKEAFLMKPNLVGLSVGVVAAAMLPFTGPLLLGVAALEGAYLWSMSRNPRFQRAVRSRRGG
jgi:hypothetical protein